MNKGTLKYFTLLFTLFCVFTTSIQAQEEKSVWTDLAKISFTKEYDEVMGFKIDKPVFSESVRNYEGKEVTLKGYIIPVEGYKSHKEFVFSAFPYNMCFFCGGAGPESVVEVKAKDAVKFQAESIVIKGILRLNADDVNRLMYAIEDAVVVSKS